MRQPMVETMKGRLLEGLETARRLGADGAKISFSQKETAGCSFENGRLKSAETGQNLGFGVEVLVEGKRGTTSGNRPDEVGEMVERAVALARLGSPAHFTAYPAPAVAETVQTHSERTVALGRDEMIAACQQIADALKALDPDLFIVAGADRSEAEGLLVTSGGVCHVSKGTHWGMGGYAQRTEGTDILFAGERRGWRDLNEFFDPGYIADCTIEDLRRASRTAEAPQGKVAAVLAPEILGMLLQAVLMGVNGRAVAKGESPLADRLGEQILDASVTIHDDPHLAFCPGASALDSDGIPTRPTMIVENGVLRTFLYDLDSAGLAGADPTGHSGCHPYCPEVLAGETPHDQLLAGLEDGLYVKRLIGFGQSNLMNGDFSANIALGYRVRDGEIVGRVKNAMIAGNVYNLLGRKVTLASDRDPVRRIPSGRVEDLSVSAAVGA
jgi:PmbA protein